MAFHLIGPHFISHLVLWQSHSARFISNKRKFDHITLVLRDQLHWLPIHQRIEFKIAVFVRNAVQWPSMVEARLPSAAPAILSGRSTPGLICGLLCGATWLCLEPKPVASGLEISVSPDRLFGTHFPRTFELWKCRWNVSNLCWKHIYFAKHMPSSAHSAFVTWLGAPNKCVVHLHLELHQSMHSLLFPVVYSKVPFLAHCLLLSILFLLFQWYQEIP